MEKIKFRGKVCGLEKLVYGDLLNTAQPCIVPTKGNHSPIPVEKDSIAQFVGYDADGNEVYEGDICKCEELGECFIALSGYSVPGYLPLNSKEIEWYLKE